MSKEKTLEMASKRSMLVAIGLILCNFGWQATHEQLWSTALEIGFYQIMAIMAFMILFIVRMMFSSGENPAQI